MKLPIGQVKPNPENPRIIKDEKFKKLVQSLKDFPEMSEVREIVLNKDHVILGGNMRLKAMKEAGWAEVPVRVVDWSPEKQKEFVIKDNSNFGEWDYDILANQYEATDLDAWGIDLPDFGESEDGQYTKKTESPTYEVTGDKPELAQLVDLTKTIQLTEKIEATDLPEDVKTFLRLAAQRHTIFDYGKIAEYYAHSEKGIQELMEQSALVIIDFKKAIEEGYVKLSKDLSDQYLEDHAK